MRVIGFRCYPKGFVFVVVSGTQEKWSVVAYDACAVPKDFTPGMGLWWVRKQIKELIGKYQLEIAGMKITETLPQFRITKVTARSEVEGVIKEAFYSQLKTECATKRVKDLKSGIADLTDMDVYLERRLNNSYPKKLRTGNYKDAILAAIAELPPE